MHLAPTVACVGRAVACTTGSDYTKSELTRRLCRAACRARPLPALALWGLDPILCVVSILVAAIRGSAVRPLARLFARGPTGHVLICGCASRHQPGREGRKAPRT